MKKILLMTIIFVFLPAIAAFAQTVPNYGGEWTLDMQKSKIPPAMRVSSWTMKVAQTEKDLKVENVVQREKDNLSTIIMNYSLEGKETTSEFSNERGPVTAISRTSKEKDGKLVMKSDLKADSPTGELKSQRKEIWELIEEGRTLKVTRETTSGVVNLEMYFTRK